MSGSVSSCSVSGPSTLHMYYIQLRVYTCSYSVQHEITKLQNVCSTGSINEISAQEVCMKCGVSVAQEVLPSACID